jgi:hypothetical protein
MRFAAVPRAIPIKAHVPPAKFRRGGMVCRPGGACGPEEDGRFLPMSRACFGPGGPPQLMSL